MDRLRDRAWQQGIAILLTLAGAALIYSGAGESGELDAVAAIGAAILAIGIALPLVAEITHGSRSNQSKSEDV